MNAKGIGGVAWSHDGALLAAKEMTGSLKIFDSDNIGKKPLRSVKLGKRARDSVSSEAKPIIAAAEKRLFTWLMPPLVQVTARLLARKRAAAAFHRIAFSPDGELLVTAVAVRPYVARFGMSRKMSFSERYEISRFQSPRSTSMRQASISLVASFADTEIIHFRRQ